VRLENSKTMCNETHIGHITKWGNCNINVGDAMCRYISYDYDGPYFN